MQENTTDVQSRIESVKQYLVLQFELTDEQIDTMLPVFIDTLHGHMKELEQMVSKDDIQGMKKMAHTLKGALLNLGLKDFADIALRLEKFDGENESMDFCHSMVEELSGNVLALHL